MSLSHRRRTFAASVPVVVAVGLAARFGLSGGIADAAGGVAYSVLVYVLLAGARPSLSPVNVGIAALACSTLIELFQLTSVPADLAEWFPPLRLIFGESFAAADLVAYAIGALAAVALDLALQDRRHRRAS